MKEAVSLRREELVGKSVALSHFNDMSESYRGSFHGDFNRCVRQFEEGTFGEGTPLIYDLMKEMDGEAFQVVKWRFRIRLEEGDSVDVERYLEGQARCWDGCRRIRRTRPTVRIYVNYGGNCDKSARQLAVQGAVGVTLAEAAEAAGMSSEIWGVNYVRGYDADHTDLMGMICLKHQNEYADAGMISFVLGDSTFYRNLVFRTWIKDAARRGCDVTYFLGSHRDVNMDDIGLTEDERATAFVVPSFYRKEDGEEWLKKSFFALTSKEERNEEEENVQ